MNSKDILSQSNSAYNQWKVQWREQAKYVSKFKMKPMTDFENSGVGKAVLCVANGYSFEENLELIKKYQDNIDILACDKTFGHLVSNGIKPKYLMICDANVDYDRYLKPYLDQVKDTIVFASVCCNPKWLDNVPWKDLYFFVNKDILGSEKEFSGLSGCNNFIPAGTNVSNAMVVLLTQSDNAGRRNFFGYDKILLIGFDYSWRAGKKYYSFNELAENKANYMCHAYIVTYDGSFAYTSGNLSFSAEWLGTYAKAFQLPLIQCTKATITTGIPFGDLEKQIQYKYKREDSAQVKKLVNNMRQVVAEKRDLENKLAAIGKDHWYQHVATS